MKTRRPVPQPVVPPPRPQADFTAEGAPPPGLVGLRGPVGVDAGVPGPADGDAPAARKPRRPAKRTHAR